MPSLDDMLGSHDDWKLAHRTTVNADRDLNTYGTLFGGRLMAIVGHQAARHLGGRLVGMEDFDFVGPTYPGEEVSLWVRSVREETDSLTAEVVAAAAAPSSPLRPTAKSVVTVSARPERASGPALELPDHDIVGKIWLFPEDVEANQRIRMDNLIYHMDKAALIYCRLHMNHRRTVLKRVIDLTIHRLPRVDEILTFHGRVDRVGRSSLRIACAVGRHNPGIPSQLVCSCKVVMVATDERGRAVPHGMRKNGQHTLPQPELDACFLCREKPLVSGVLCADCLQTVTLPGSLLPEHVQGRHAPESPACLVDSMGRPWAVFDGTTLGRKRCDVNVLHRSVSRVHAELLREGPAWRIRDRGSRNGTFLNDRRVSDAVTIRAGDRLRLSEVPFLFALGNPGTRGRYLTAHDATMMLDDLRDLRAPA